MDKYLGVRSPQLGAGEIVIASSQRRRQRDTLDVETDHAAAEDALRFMSERQSFRRWRAWWRRLRLEAMTAERVSRSGKMPGASRRARVASGV
jgi:hypothetical protein